LRRYKAYNNLGNVYDTLGDWSSASYAFHKSLAINREIGDILEQGLVTVNLGNIELNRGEWDEAARLYEQGDTIWKQLGAAFPEAVTLSNLAQVHIYMGDWSEARTCLKRSGAIFDEIGTEDWLPELERRWGEYCLGTGALDEALAHLALAQEEAVDRTQLERAIQTFERLGAQADRDAALAVRE
jgi:tetratricopeptide (TPR) repeat protein